MSIETCKLLLKAALNHWNQFLLQVPSVWLWVVIVNTTLLLQCQDQFPPHIDKCEKIFESEIFQKMTRFWPCWDHLLDGFLISINLSNVHLFCFLDHYQLNMDVSYLFYVTTTRFQSLLRMVLTKLSQYEIINDFKIENLDRG